MSATESKSLGGPFRKLFYAFTANKISDGLISGTMPLLATRLTQDPILIASLGAASMLPWLLFAIPIGSLVDRLNRRTILVAMGIIRSAISFAVAVALFTDALSIAWLLVASFVVGTCDVFSDTSTQSLVPRLLKENQLERGNSRLQAVDTISIGFAGAPLGSVIFVWSMFAPFLIESAGFLAGAMFLLSIPATLTAVALSAGSKETFRQSMVGGISYLIRHKQLLRLVITTAAIGFCFQVGTSTQVLFVLKVLHLPKIAYGTLMAAGSIGAILGAAVASRMSARFGRGSILAFGITLCSAAEVAQGLAPNFWVYAAVMLLGGFGLAMWNILLLSTYQLMIPNEIFGRIHGTRRTLVWGLMPIGMLLGGALAHLGLRVPPVGAGIAATLIGLISYSFITKLGNNPPLLT